MIKRILIVQTAFIGDVILITPLIRETRKLFPDSVIDVLVTKGNQTILKNNPYLNNILVTDKKKVSSYFKTLFTLIKNRYNIVLTPHRSARTLTLLFLAGIKVRIGFNRDIYRHLLNYQLRHPQDVHKAQKNLELLSPFIGDKYPKLQLAKLNLKREELNWESELFPGATDLEHARKYLYQDQNIAIAPGSVWNTKRWSKENYIILAKLLKDQGFNLVFIGSNGERELAQEIINKAEIEAINSCGKLSILQSAALISQCRALICNDSGALHIGNAVDTKVFAFFGPTVRQFGYYPYRQNDFVFELDLACRPCGMHGHKQCPLGHHNSMKMIEPMTVLQNILKKMNL
jgi:heptosyltransferase-2